MDKIDIAILLKQATLKTKWMDENEKCNKEYFYSFYSDTSR